MTRHLASVPNGRSLDPVELSELAQAMSDESWVDMRVVPGGIAERVQVIGIWVMREAERIQLRQFAPDPDGVQSEARHWVDADCIWWIRPTAFTASDEIKPFTAAVTKLSSVRSDPGTSFLDAAFEGVAWYRRMPRRELEAAARAGLDAEHHRYWVMLVYRELTDRKLISDRDVTKVFGYMSIQPLQSARDYAKRQGAASPLQKMVEAARLRMP